MATAANESASKDHAEDLEGERVFWDRLWERLAEADGHDTKREGYGESGYPSIHIEQLKKRINGRDATKVGWEILKLNLGIFNAQCTFSFV